MSRSSSARQTFVIPVRLGHVADYDRSIFPLSRLKSTAGLLREGDLLLEATMDEMARIFNMSKDLQEYQSFLQDSKGKYDELMKRKKQLEKQRKSMNPFNFFATHRETRLFVTAGRRLFFSTRTTSEAMRRALLSITSDSVAPAQGENHEEVSGIAINLDGPPDDTVASFLTETASLLASVSDPFADPTPSQYVGDTADDSRLAPPPTSVPSSSSSRSSNSSSSPTSPSPTSSVNHFHIYAYNNAIHNENSVVRGFTLQNGGHQNSGSVIHDTYYGTPPGY
ncbi:hypothetical protein F5I97DRAFT_1857595 [Phlebopus sp. FC_14]|nr:hypothetical protein F5I97DRAFT_1857595 [Phlebopus sp. FC_14]